MGIEIERKFLVNGTAWQARVTRQIRMAQAYLNDLQMVESGALRSSVRVRIEDDRAFLNIKSAQRGAARQEFEYEIPCSDARDLLKLCVGGVVEKTRHWVEHDGFRWEIDEFGGDNAGLIVAEIELPSEDTAFDLPEWAGVEVTQHLRYYNLALAEYPFRQWAEQERAGPQIGAVDAC